MLSQKPSATEDDDHQDALFPFCRSRPRHLYATRCFPPPRNVFPFWAMSNRLCMSHKIRMFGGISCLTATSV
jgi:hypothetical protein